MPPLPPILPQTSGTIGSHGSNDRQQPPLPTQNCTVKVKNVKKFATNRSILNWNNNINSIILWWLNASRHKLHFRIC
ncbi:MAG: hypothetical protein H0X30_12825 [Anaerolineae bacterium]|nr:hypothetical protein [Anaerolineae bacterium]